MSDTSIFSEKLGLHIMLVTMATRLLRGDASLRDLDLEEALVYFHEQRPGTLQVLLHEDPLYIAGHILALSSAEVDKLSAENTAIYHDLYKQITERTRGRRRDYLRKIWAALTELALRENMAAGNFELQLIEPSASSPGGTQPPARRSASRRRS